MSNPIQKRIEEIEEEIKKTPLHKASEHHIGTLRARVAQLKEKMETQGQATNKRHVYAVKKEGDATVMLMGYPSVGKSSLLNKITNAKSQTAAYKFTTLQPIPGMMKYKKAKIQIIDLPGIIEHASKGHGRGREILSAIRSSDLILIMLNPEKAQKELDVILKELDGAGVRLDQKPKNIILKKEIKGGLRVDTVKQKKITLPLIKKTLQSFGYNNGQIVINEQITQEQLIDAIIGNRHYVPSLVIVTKKDLKKNKKFFQISALKEEGLNELKQKIFKKLRLIRIYTRKPSGDVDYEEPLIVQEPVTVKGVMKKLRIKKEKCKITGPSAKFENQNVSLKHFVKDEDILTFY